MKYVKMCMMIFLYSSATGASDVPHTYIQQAENQYVQGDYNVAVKWILSIPGLAYFAPNVTPLDTSTRAKIFFDLGCCYLAASDSIHADLAFQQAFALDSKLKNGFFENANPGTFWWALLRNQEVKRRLKTKRLSAAMRSLVVPGWGQFYRGYQKKGYAMMGAAIVSSGILMLKLRSYRAARSHYEQTSRDVVLPIRYANNDENTRYSEFEERHRNVLSNARSVNLILGVMGGIWALSFADGLIFGPASMGVSISF